MSAQKQKGTKAETHVVCWARKHMLHAERLALCGAHDVGDVRLIVEDGWTVMIQVKDGYTDRKEPSDYLIGQWLEETERQRRNGGWNYALLVHKRYGKADPDDWRWYMDGSTFASLLTREVRTQACPPYVQLQGYMIPELLKRGLEMRPPIRDRHT